MIIKIVRDEGTLYTDTKDTTDTTFTTVNQEARYLFLISIQINSRRLFNQLLFSDQKIDWRALYALSCRYWNSSIPDNNNNFFCF